MTQREQTLNSEDKFLEELESYFREIMSEITETHRYNLKQELKAILRNARKEHAIEFMKQIAKSDIEITDGKWYHKDDGDGDYPFIAEQLYNKFNLNKTEKS